MDDSKYPQILLNTSIVGCFPNHKFVDIGVLLPEVFALPIFVAAIYVMYRGVEIDHPVFRIIFNNLIFQLTITAIVILFQLLSSIRNNAILASELANLAGLLFHNSTWLILSFLRYAYKVKPDLLHSKFPDPGQISKYSQAAVISFCFLTLAAMFAIFSISMISLGWPQVSFCHGISTTSRNLIILGSFLVFLSPVLISIVFYVLLVISLAAKLKRVGVDNSSGDGQQVFSISYGGIYIGPTYDDRNEIEVSVAQGNATKVSCSNY